MISEINIEGACSSIDEQARFIVIDENIKNEKELNIKKNRFSRIS